MHSATSTVTAINSTTTIAQSIKVIISGIIERMLKKMETHYVHAGCQKDLSIMSWGLVRVLS